MKHLRTRRVQKSLFKAGECLHFPIICSHYSYTDSYFHGRRVCDGIFAQVKLNRANAITSVQSAFHAEFINFIHAKIIIVESKIIVQRGKMRISFSLLCKLYFLYFLENGSLLACPLYLDVRSYYQFCFLNSRFLPMLLRLGKKMFFYERPKYLKTLKSLLLVKGVQTTRSSYQCRKFSF